MKPVVILGAGLSGLACAKTLKERGRDVLVLEAKSKVGGRVCSFRTSQGFMVDEGFQVLLSSYPELASMVSLERLHLRPFNSGALIFNGKGLDLLANPFRHPKEIIKTLKFPSASLKDKWLVVRLMASSQKVKSDTSLGEKSTLEFLRGYGFSDGFIEDFWRPFLCGVYLDPDLSMGSDFFQFLIRCFAWGKVCLPEQGMEQLPLMLASQISPSIIRLNSRAKSWTEREVTLENGEKIEAAQVVCAFDQEGKANTEIGHFRQVTTHYFTSTEFTKLGWDKWLILIPPRFKMNITHLALISSVAKSYGSGSHPLLSVSVVGSKKVDLSVIREEVETIAAKSLSLDWVATTEVPQALPIINQQTFGFEIRQGVIHCGDRYASPSINGALRSGRVAAEYLLKVGNVH